METIVILGAGHAGCQAAFALRENGFRGRVTLVNGEEAAPYQRPPLSKGYMKSGRCDEILLRAETAFADHDIHLVSGVAEEIDRDRQQVRLGTGDALPYDHLILAMGTVNRRVSAPAGDTGVHYLKSLRDADILRVRLPQTRRVAVIGAGFIGLEFAALAAAQGKTVEVVDIGMRVMARATSEEVSDFFRHRHQDAGVRFHLGQGVAEIFRHLGNRATLLTTAGGEIEADLVVAGIGVMPNTELAARAGLAVDNGIVVDTYLSTTDPAISAIGDCAQFPSPHAAAPIRLESVQNANDHARCVARRLTGDRRPYAAVPWFWSDQGSDKLQIAGLPGEADRQVLRGDPERNRFSVFRFRNGQLASVESVNQPAEHMVARRLIGSRSETLADHASDTAVAAKELLLHLQPGNAHASV